MTYMGEDAFQVTGDIFSMFLPLNEEVRAMMVIIRGDEIAFVLNVYGEGKLGLIDFEKRDFTDAGMIYGTEGVEVYGILEEIGYDKKQGKFQYRVISNKQVECDDSFFRR